MQTSFTDTHDSPPIPDGNDPSAPRSTHHGEAPPRGVSARPSLARGRAGTRSMSGRGRCACREQRALRGGEIKGERWLAWHADGNVRQRQRWRLGKDQGAGKMDQGTDRTAVVRSIVPICGIRGLDLRGIRRIRAWRRWTCPPISAPPGRDARGRTSARVGTQAQTAPGTNPISTVTGTSPSVVALARLTSAADLFLRADAATLVTMLHYGNWPLPIPRSHRSVSSRVLQKILSGESAHRRVPQPMRHTPASSREILGQRPSRIQVAARLPTRRRRPISPANTGNTPMPRTTLASRTRNPSQSSP